MMTDMINLRVPKGMRDRLQDAAKANGRSMNAEIVHRLSTWSEPTVAAQAVIEVDGRQVDATLHLVNQLGEAAEKALDACKRLGIKLGGEA